MAELPYFVSWQNQSNLKAFPLKSYEGAIYYLENGEELIDLCSTSYHTSFGGNPKSIVQRVSEELFKGPMACPKAITDLKLSATNSLLNFMEIKQGKIYYTLSGSESVENALKIARQVTQKKVIIARKRSYHGATLGALAATGDWRNTGSLVPNDWTLRIPEPYEDPTFKKSIEIIKNFGIDNIAALIIEPVSAANGVIIPPREWLMNLQKFCKQNKIFVIYDEVCTGFYRTGTKFAYQRFEELEPDIVCMGKNISGGVFPFGAVWVNSHISDFFNHNVLLCGSTNYAHPGGLAAMESVIEILSDQAFIDSLSPLTKTFTKSLAQIEKLSAVKEIRQIGLLAAIELNTKVEWQPFIDQGVYCGVHGDYITLAPPYVISGKELIMGMERIKKVLELL